MRRPGIGRIRRREMREMNEPSDDKIGALLLIAMAAITVVGLWMAWT